MIRARKGKATARRDGTLTFDERPEVYLMPRDEGWDYRARSTRLLRQDRPHAHRPTRRRGSLPRVRERRPR
jgi:hypothetical protein